MSHAIGVGTQLVILDEPYNLFKKHGYDIEKTIDKYLSEIMNESGADLNIWMVIDDNKAYSIGYVRSTSSNLQNVHRDVVRMHVHSSEQPNPIATTLRGELSQTVKTSEIFNSDDFGVDIRLSKAVSENPILLDGLVIPIKDFDKIDEYADELSDDDVEIGQSEDEFYENVKNKLYIPQAVTQAFHAAGRSSVLDWVNDWLSEFDNAEERFYLYVWLHTDHASYMIANYGVRRHDSELIMSTDIDNNDLSNLDYYTRAELFYVLSNKDIKINFITLSDQLIPGSKLSDIAEVEYDLLLNQESISSG